MSKCKILDEYTSKLNAIYEHIGLLREYVFKTWRLRDTGDCDTFAYTIDALNALQEEVNAVDKDE